MASNLQISEQSGFGLAVVMAHKGTSAAAIGERLGLDLPAGSGAVGDAALTLFGIGPGSWLARTDEGDADWAEALGTRLGGIASVTDVSGGYRLFRLAGGDARLVLRRGAFVDFDPAVFAPGSVATTVIAHIGVIIRQIDDTPVYELAVFRSLGESFRHWLTTTAATL